MGGDQTPPLCINNRERLEPGLAGLHLHHSSFNRYVWSLSEEVSQRPPVLSTRAGD